MRQELRLGELFGHAGKASPQATLVLRPTILGAPPITTHRWAITDFLIDTATIRIDVNSRRINMRTVSNRHCFDTLATITFVRSRNSNGD
jgi:hypothetical protein